MRATFYLHNGATFTVDVDRITRVTNNITKETTEFKWVHVTEGVTDDLFFVKVEEVDAIVVRDTDAQQALPPVKM